MVGDISVTRELYDLLRQRAKQAKDPNEKRLIWQQIHASAWAGRFNKGIY